MGYFLFILFYHRQNILMNNPIACLFFKKKICFRICYIKKQEVEGSTRNRYIFTN